MAVSSSSSSSSSSSAFPAMAVSSTAKTFSKQSTILPSNMNMTTEATLSTTSSLRISPDVSDTWDLQTAFSTAMTSLHTMATENVTSSNVSATSWTSVVDVDQFLQQKNDEFTLLVLPAIILLGILSIVGVTGNSMVLYVYNRKLCKGTIRWFVQALAIFDLLSCLVAIPGEIFDMRNNYTFGSSSMCKVLRTVSMFCTVSSGMTLMVVAVERYKRICTPLRKQITPKQAQGVITVCTVAASVCAAPACIIYGKQTIPTDNPFINGSDCSTADVFIGTLIPLGFSAFQFLLFIVGAVALVAVYVLIGRRIWSHARFRRAGFHAGAANRRMSFFFNGSECSSPTTDDMVFAFPGNKKAAGEAERSSLGDVKNDQSNNNKAAAHSNDSKTVENNNNKKAEAESNNNKAMSNDDNINNNDVKNVEKDVENDSESAGPGKRVRKTAVYDKPSLDATDEGSEVIAEEAAPGNACLPEETGSRPVSPVDKSLPFVTEDFLREVHAFDTLMPPTPSGDTSFGADRSEDSGNETAPIENHPTPQPEDLTKACDVVMRTRPSTSRQTSRDSRKDNPRETPPTSPTGDVSKAFDDIRRKKPSPPSRQTSRDHRKSGDSSGFRGRYRRRSTQHAQSDHMRRILSRSDSVKSGTRRTTLMLFLITLVYLLSFLPYLVLMVLKALDQDSLSGRGDWSELAHNILLRSYFINSMANPIIYSYCSRTFRAESSKLIHCRCCKRPFVY